MLTTNTFLEDKMDLRALYSRKKTDVIYNQTPIQPIQQFYNPGENIRLVLQRSRSMINISKLAIMFRPVICYNSSDSLPDVARRSFQCPTPIKASDFFQMTSLTFNGNQLLSQSGIAQDTPRNLFMSYYSSLSTKKKNLLSGEEYSSGLLTPTSTYQLNDMVGESEISSTHPYMFLGADAASTISSKLDVDPYARAIISKCFSYNLEHNLPPTSTGTAGAIAAAKIRASNAYFAAYLDPIGSPAIPFNFGGVPIATADSGDNVIYPVNFAAAPMNITPSVSSYKSCNEKFQVMRMRFITATTSGYSYTGTAVIQTNNQQPIGQSLGTGFDTASTAYAQTKVQNLAGTSVLGPQRIVYGTSVQGPYGCYASAASNAPTRYPGQKWTATDGTFFPEERYTNMMCEMGELSIECAQIQTVCMDSTQVVILLQPSNPNQVLSAYLQPGYLGIGANITPLPAIPASSANWQCGASSANCQAFLNSCLLGTVTYKLTDVCCRIEYDIYPESSYSVIRQLLYQPVPYQSLRIQVDQITTITSSFSQRVSLGGCNLVNGVCCFILPRFAPLSNQVKPIRPQDTVVNYQSLQMPSLNDARYIASLDSAYLEFSQFSVFLDSNVYESSPLIPISSPQYSTYLKTQDAWYQMFGKHLNIDLKSFLLNRSSIAVSINPHNDRSLICTDSQLIITSSWNAQSRIDNAIASGEQRQAYEGGFSLYTVVITSQSLVNDDYVKVN